MIHKLSISLLVLITGCTVLPTQSEWKRSAQTAFFHPNTIIPLVGAGIFTIDDFDEKVAEWLAKHHPVYGSSAGARDAGRLFKNILRYESYITALAAEDKRLERLGVGIGAWNVTKGATSVLKKEIDRLRPNGTNDYSFPSRCASSAFSSATVSNRNLNHNGWLSDDVRKDLQFGNLCLASGVVWARVERDAHYPSDVLFGAALGHFLTAFIYDAFLPGNNFAVVPSQGGVMFRVTFNF